MNQDIDIYITIKIKESMINEINSNSLWLIKRKNSKYKFKKNFMKNTLRAVIIFA
jgi:hypothetical protein